MSSTKEDLLQVKTAKYRPYFFRVLENFNPYTHRDFFYHIPSSQQFYKARPFGSIALALHRKIEFILEDLGFAYCRRQHGVEFVYPRRLVSEILHEEYTKLERRLADSLAIVKRLLLNRREIITLDWDALLGRCEEEKTSELLLHGYRFTETIRCDLVHRLWSDEYDGFYFKFHGFEKPEYIRVHPGRERQEWLTRAVAYCLENDVDLRALRITTLRETDHWKANYYSNGT